MKKINQRVKLVCLLTFSFVSGVQATSLAAPLVVTNCSDILVCDKGILDVADINTEAIINAGVERDHNFSLTDDLGFLRTDEAHPFLSFLNVDDRKYENISANDSVYDADLASNSIADDVSLEISLTESDYAVAVVDIEVGSAEGSYTALLPVTSIPPAVLLLGSGVLGLVVITRRKRNDVTNSFATS